MDNTTDSHGEQQSANQTETFDPPVDIIEDPLGCRTRRRPNIVEIRYGVPRDCDVKLVPQYGGSYTTNPEFIRVADDDPRNRSLKKND
jgi:hypothetical protein